MQRCKIFILAIVLAGFVSCAGSEDIFPTVVLDTAEATAILPNPISIIPDAANNQILVANSNVDIFFDTGSLAVLSVDTSDPSAPQLSIAQLIESPNFACEMATDGAGSVFIPFREESDFNDQDILRTYTLAAGGITLADEGTVADDPFGTALSGGQLFIVSDDILGIYDANLDMLAEIDLTTAEEAELEDAESELVQDVAVDAANSRAIVSNSGGKMFVVDLSSESLVQAIEGPTSTRDIILDGTRLYALDAAARLVWIFDLAHLPAPDSPPEDQDDSEFLIGTVSVGTIPAAMALDSTNNRLYVSNSADDTISVIDTQVFLELARISLDDEDLPNVYLRDGEAPEGLALGTFGGTQYLFVAAFGSNAVIMIDTTTLRVAEVFPDNLVQFDPTEDDEDDDNEDD